MTKVKNKAASAKSLYNTWSVTILNVHRERGVPMALASRTPTPDVARAFLKKLGTTVLALCCLSAVLLLAIRDWKCSVTPSAPLPHLDCTAHYLSNHGLLELLTAAAQGQAAGKHTAATLLQELTHFAFRDLALAASVFGLAELRSAGWSSGVFDSQQLIPASSGFDHSSSQKDQNHFPAIQVV